MSGEEREISFHLGIMYCKLDQSETIVLTPLDRKRAHVWSNNRKSDKQGVTRL